MNQTSFRLLCFLTIIHIVMLSFKIMTNPHCGFPNCDQDWTFKELSFITNQTGLPFSKGKQEASVQQPITARNSITLEKY